MYPEGDKTASPSERMPRSGYFFDDVIRQEPIDEEQLYPEDNLEKFYLVNEADPAFWKESAAKGRATGKAVIAGIDGTAWSDIVLVPGL